MPNLGPSELLIVLVILLVLFGGGKLPKLARSLGTARREFERGQAVGLADDDAEPATR
jgi:sec-independent protein translocase protein TatA